MSSTKPSSTSGWEPPSPEALQAMLPQYEITGILGRGGMGAVYRGRQVNLERDVAIKLLPETFTKGEDELNFVARFKQEARAMAKLDHPAILSVHDFGETADGQLYFVMEFVDGMDIHQYLHHHGGKLPQEQALAIVAHVLDALDYAHGHGIVHRDIKPANILLNREGRVKIADFGLAKRFGEGAGDSVPALTMSNVAVGTPDFVAPEALDSDQTPDHRADLYAVGVMLYQLLTGRIPRGNYRSPSELDPEIDPRLDGIVEKAMESDPDYRYQSAAAVRVDLDAIFSQPFAKVEAGEASEAVAVAVPVTTSVRGGKPSQSASKSKTPLLLGVATAAVLAVGWIVMATKDKGEANSSIGILRGGPPPMPSTEKTTASEQTPIASKPHVAPVESIGWKPMPQENSRTSTSTEPPPPTPSTEKKPAVAAAPKPAPEKKAPEPVAPPAVATTPPAKTPAASPPPTLPPSLPQSPPAPPANAATPLLSIPGLQTRLDAYHAARRGQLADLATKYGRGLETRLGQAADAGDLKLATAFGDEKARVEALVQTLATPPPDPVAAAGAPVALPDLAPDSPAALAALRQTWTTESAKIRGTLDAALAQSLQALEVELTKARELEKAKAVLAWRESLAAPRPATAATTPIATPPVPARPAGGTPVLATKDAPFENSLGMKFVPVPGTEVLFCIHEVRFRDYEEYAKKAKETVDGQWKTQTNDGFEIKKDEKDHPVTKVNWDDAQAFCKWLSEKEGLTYRLPTDREWSHAVGIGRKEEWKDDTTPATVFKVPDEFPWGDEWPPPTGAGNYSDASRQAKAPRDDAKYVEDGYDDGFPTTAPVMSFAANKYGLFDLGGNVWEWCEDWYSGEQKERVLRGASWGNHERGTLLSSTRYRNTPEFRSSNYGFRVVVVPSASGR